MVRFFLPFALICWLLMGCPSDLQNPQQDNRDAEQLTERAEEHWMALRWQRMDVAGLAYESVDGRLAFLESWANDNPSKLVDTTIIGVELDDPLPRTAGSPRQREARVIVQLECYAERDLLLETRIEVQQWYRTADGWFIEPPQRPTD